MARRRRRRRTRTQLAGIAGLGAALSRKHYTAVADILCVTDAPVRTKEAFADYFAGDNRAFKRELFLRATDRCKR